MDWYGTDRMDICMQDCIGSFNTHGYNSLEKATGSCPLQMSLSAFSTFLDGPLPANNFLTSWYKSWWWSNAVLMLCAFRPPLILACSGQTGETAVMTPITFTGQFSSHSISSLWLFCLVRDQHRPNGTLTESCVKSFNRRHFFIAAVDTHYKKLPSVYADFL